MQRPLRVWLARLGGLLAACACVLAAHAQTPPDAAAARVLGAPVACTDLGASDRRACARALFGYVLARIERDYVERRGLAATPGELAALEAYNAAFERHDREQRTRKLAELEERLARPPADAAERERLLAFHDVLARLARFDADVDAGVAQRTTVEPQTLCRVIERAKLEVALHAEYGGIVGVAASGPYAHGARVALIEDHLTNGRIELHDPEVARRFLVLLHAAPAIVDRTAAPDFTPFWQRPIPDSYVAP